jgi:hypothetical protein
MTSSAMASGVGDGEGVALGATGAVAGTASVVLAAGGGPDPPGAPCGTQELRRTTKRARSSRGPCGGPLM